MENINQYDRSLGRIRWMALMMCAMFVGLASHIWSIQVTEGHVAVSELERQSLRTVRIPGVRGQILDRRGEILVDNRPSYCISVLMEELVKQEDEESVVDATDRVLDELSDLLEIPRTTSRDDVHRHLRARALLPLIAWKNVGMAAVARFSENQDRFPGVHIYVDSLRVYPHRATAAHVLGYVRPEGVDRQVDMSEDYLIPDVTGADGIERVKNDILKGEYGRAVLLVDALGFKHGDELSEIEPTPGQDLYLTLDLRIQKLVESRFSAMGNRPAAAVILDVRNGDVLAMASAPDFDPNAFVPSISRGEWAKLRDSPLHPMVNRTVSAYPPGSLFKPVFALTAMHSVNIDPEESFTCEYVYRIGGPLGREMRCWNKNSHGDIAMRRALEQSCNVYYYNLASHLKMRSVWHVADNLGFGHKTGVEVLKEYPGLNPNDSWKRADGRGGWRLGDTANYYIGQGFLTASPLQLAVMTAAVANGGKVYQPSLVYAVSNPDTGVMERRRPVLAQTIPWKDEALDVVRGGMLDVIHTETGTGACC